ncbi:hypothetical protein Bca52824_093570 [Brassica carinata]|uniref:Uncharacterized protein n=1 Tax=Brassica carinata TaxID=52824 RepID=A0A8X7P605_BRACI|nr:hypothetical protein Bca52824_093570 [Brassica carinata]
MESSEPKRCRSTVVETIDAPLPLVWSVLRRFDKPQAYKRFVKSCTIRFDGDGDRGEGSVRDVTLRLDELDDESHVMVVSIIGGNRRLANFTSKTVVVASPDDEEGKTVVVESYIVDVPEGNSEEDTILFVFFFFFGVNVKIHTIFSFLQCCQDNLLQGTIKREKKIRQQETS